MITTEAEIRRYFPSQREKEYTKKFLLISFPRASVGMPSGRASVPFSQRWRVAHGIPTLARQCH